jgi:hypothetical protein
MTSFKTYRYSSTAKQLNSSRKPLQNKLDRKTAIIAHRKTAIITKECLASMRIVHSLYHAVVADIAFHLFVGRKRCVLAVPNFRLSDCPYSP